MWNELFLDQSDKKDLFSKRFPILITSNLCESKKRTIYRSFWWCTVHGWMSYLDRIFFSIYILKTRLNQPLFSFVESGVLTVDTRDGFAVDFVAGWQPPSKELTRITRKVYMFYCIHTDNLSDHDNYRSNDQIRLFRFRRWFCLQEFISLCCRLYDIFVGKRTPWDRYETGFPTLVSTLKISQPLQCEIKPI